MGINGTSSHVNIFTPQFIASFSYFKIIEVFIFYFSHWTLYFFQFHSYKLQLHGFTCWDRFLSACSCIWIKKNSHRGLWPSGICMSVTPAVSYLPTRLAGCSVGPEISCGACKLARTPRITKKKIYIKVESWNKFSTFEASIYLYFIHLDGDKYIFYFSN